MVKQTNSACAMRSGRGGVGVGAVVVVVVVEDDDDDDAMRCATSSWPTVGNCEIVAAFAERCERRCGLYATTMDGVIIRARVRAMCDD